MTLPFSHRKRMIGGLHFGPAGWLPMRFDLPTPQNAPPEFDVTLPPPSPIKTLQDLQALLEKIGLHDTNPFIPSLTSQLQDLHGTPTFIINMLPQQPESMLPSALTFLVLPEISAALLLLQRIIPHRRTLIALEKHDHRTRRLWHAATQHCHVSRAHLLNRYPQANPTVLARRLLGRRLPVGTLPTASGILMLDPVSLWAIGHFLVTGLPLTHRPIEIFCKDRDPLLVLAPLHTPLAPLLQSHNVPLENQQVIVNGIMAGTEADPLLDTVTPTTQMVSVRPLPLREMPSACISCGWCVDHCPTELNPIRLHDLSLQTGALKADEAFESLHCIGCGLCSYVCPTRLPLAPQIISLRTLARAEIKRLTGAENIVLPLTRPEAKS